MPLKAMQRKGSVVPSKLTNISTLTDSDDLEQEISIILTSDNTSISNNNQVIFNHKEMGYKKNQEMLPINIHYSSFSYVQEEEDETDDEDKQMENIIKEKKLQNQFNFSDRGTQTPVIPSKSKKVQTIPSLQSNFSANTLQWEIYDYYTKDAEQQEKVKDNEKINEKAATGGGINVETRNLTKSKVANKLETLDITKSLQIVERIVNQNTYDEISQDFRYWEDLSDEFKSGQGSVLPLWKFYYNDLKGLTVTAVQWNTRYDDMFIASYGSHNFMDQRNGFICVYSLCNPTHPEYTIPTVGGATSVDVHPIHCYLLVAGFDDGTVSVYDTENKSPLSNSNSELPIKHSDQVWQVQWHKDLDGNHNFHSISADGLVILWTLIKNVLHSSEVLKLNLDDTLFKELNLPIVTMPASGTTFAFHSKFSSVFLVGTSEGRIFGCNKAYSNGIQMEYEKHDLAVNRICWSEFHQHVFASCSADGTVKIWEHQHKKPICTYNLQSPVGDVRWAPYSATVFAAVTSDGKIHVYDLHVKKYHPICVQTVVPKKGIQLTCIAFNKKHPIVLIGDDKGCVRTFKLSPNLRKGMNNIGNERAKMQELVNLDKYLAVMKDNNSS